MRWFLSLTSQSQPPRRVATDFEAAFGRYASEVDVDFVRRSIKAIGQAAIKIDVAAERCVNVLLDLIATRVSYVVQEAVVVMKVPSSRHWAITIPLTYTISRISSDDTPQRTKVSSPHYAPTLKSWTNQRRKRRSYGSSESMRIRSIMRMSCWVFSSRHLRKSRIPFVLPSPWRQYRFDVSLVFHCRFNSKL